MRLVNKDRRIALVTHALNGGVWTMTRFLQSVLTQQGRYAVDLIVLATSAQDPYSILLRHPGTWRRTLQPIVVRGPDLTYLHAGARWSEVEFQRYRARRPLTELLNQYDLIQVVGGSPAWAGAVTSSIPPVCVFAATTVRHERATLLRQLRGMQRVWTMWMTRMVSHLEISVLAQADCVLAESEYTQALLAPYVAPGRLRIGAPGVDTEFFCPATYAANGYILCVGRLNDGRKNVALLLRAYAQLVHTTVYVPPLRLVSQSELGPVLEDEIARLGLGDRVQRAINVSLAELRRMYQEAALFVLSSNEEGLGIVILEAMACGLPVLSTDCGGPSTAVKHGQTGLLVPVDDVAAMCEAMAELLAKPELRRAMGTEGRRRITQHFTLEAAGQVYLDAYSSLLS